MHILLRRSCLEISKGPLSRRNVIFRAATGRRIASPSDVDSSANIEAVCRSSRRRLTVFSLSTASLTGSLERPLPRLGKQCPSMFAVMSASLAVSYHPAASRCPPRTPVPSMVVCVDGGVCACACVVGVDLQLKLRSQPQASCAQALVQRLLGALQRRVQLLMLETRLEPTIQASSGTSRDCGTREDALPGPSSACNVPSGIRSLPCRCSCQ